MNSIKSHLTNKSIVHLSMYIFGAYSAMNIATFFIGIGHPMAVGWFLGVALGIGLISASIYLSKQDYHDRLPFFLLLTAVLLLAGLSGQIQYLAYLTHIETAPYAFFLGFAPPFIVEVGLALSVSFAERSEKTRLQRDSDGQIDNKIAVSMVETVSEYDTTRIKQQIEKKMDRLIMAKVDKAIARLTPTTDTTAQDFNEIPSMPSAQTDKFTEKSAQLNKERADQKKQELQTFAQFLAQNYNGCATDELNISEIERTFGKSRRTINRYISELQQADLINGHIDATLIAQM